MVPTLRPVNPAVSGDLKQESTPAPTQPRQQVESRLGARLGNVNTTPRVPPKPEIKVEPSSGHESFADGDTASNGDDEYGDILDELEQEEATDADVKGRIIEKPAPPLPKIASKSEIKPIAPHQRIQANVPTTKRPTTPTKNKNWVEIDKAAVTAEYDRLLARDDKLQTVQDREFAADSSKKIAGACQTMCPDTEAYQFVGSNALLISSVL